MDTPRDRAKLIISNTNLGAEHVAILAELFKPLFQPGLRERYERRMLAKGRVMTEDEVRHACHEMIVLFVQFWLMGLGTSGALGGTHVVTVNAQMRAVDPAEPNIWHSALKTFILLGMYTIEEVDEILRACKRAHAKHTPLPNSAITWLEQHDVRVVAEASALQ